MWITLFCVANQQFSLTQLNINIKIIFSYIYLKIIKNFIKKSEVDEFLDYIYQNYGDNILTIILHTHIFEDLKQTDFIKVCDKTESILKQLGFEWSKPEYKHIESMVKHWTNVKFM